MNVMRIVSAIVLVNCLLFQTVACDLCAIYSASQATGELGTGPFFGVAEQFTHFGTLQDEGEKVPNPTGQYLDSSVSQLFGGYHITDRWGAQLNLPLIYRSFKRPEGFRTDRGTESGVGDLSLTSSYVLYRDMKENFTFAWTALGGLKLPTGSTDRLREEFNEEEVPGAPESGIHGHDLTLGSGSVDGIIGTSFYTRWKRWFLAASTQYSLRTKGDFDYEFANDLTWWGGPGFYVLMSHTATLGIQAVVSGESKGRDTFEGEKAEDTGVTSVFLGPQINFTWSRKLNVQVGADLPVSIDNTALQAVPDYRFRAVVGWQF
jgi:hypothetical protein